jgi:hydroxymethylpyrimidine/phosphomethylpyrimidine kinase
MEQRPVCLSIGGSDSCGGAGIQADLRMFAQMGVTGCSAITALTAQNPREITRIEAVPLAQLDAELHAVFDYYRVAAVKTGMLLDAEHIAVIAAALHQHHAGGMLIVDPVMLASSGRRLLDTSAVDTLLKTLVPMATLLTPNLDEAAILLGRPISDARSDCRKLSKILNCSVLLKGGHAAGDTLLDVLCEAGGEPVFFEHPRQAWSEERAHGSGCRLAAAIAAIHAKSGASASLADVVSQAVKVCISPM